MNDLIVPKIPAPATHYVGELADTDDLPRMIQSAGDAGRWAWAEYFSGRIRNRHTRKAYLLAVRQFLDWCESHRVDLQQISPGMVGRYFDIHPGSTLTQKLHLSALRGFLDMLVQRHVIVLNPAHSVRTERHSVTEGKTPTITVEQSRKLLNSIEPESAIDFRDRAIISMLIYTAARVGAVARLSCADLQMEGHEHHIRFHEKGGKVRDIPIRSHLTIELLNYTSILPHETRHSGMPLFRSVKASSRLLTDRSLSPIDICRMIKRRLKTAELPSRISPHSFRSSAATDLLEQGVSLEDVQQLLGHADSRVTRLYDRRQRAVTRHIVERISV